MVMRDKFDFFLVKKAMKAGAYLNDQTNFISLSGTTGNLDVETTKGNFKTKIIVGADGVNSNVAKAIQLNVKKKQMMAIEAEVFLNNPETLKELQHSVHFDLGMIPGGYGWVFPKRDHLSIGMLSVSKQARDIKRFFKAYLESKAIHAHADIRSLKGHMIPYGPAKSNSYANKNGMLVGDATGFVDPITGEGIYYAFREAQIAAEIISDDVLSINESAEKYNTLLKKELMHDLDCAQKLAYILYKIPVVSHRVLKAHGKSIGENHLEIITGKKSYGELFNEVLSLSGIRTLLTIRSKQQSRMQ
jgi:flavin-dependent dehydrogenase